MKYHSRHMAILLLIVFAHAMLVLRIAGTPPVTGPRLVAAAALVALSPLIAPLVARRWPPLK